MKKIEKVILSAIFLAGSFFYNPSQLIAHEALRLYSGNRSMNNGSQFFTGAEYSNQYISAGLLRIESELSVYSRFRFQYKEHKLMAGQLHESVNEGLQLSNGSWWPDFPSFAFNQPIGAAWQFSAGSFLTNIGHYRNEKNDMISFGKIILRANDFMNFSVGTSALKESTNESATNKLFAPHARLSISFYNIGAWKIFSQWDGLGLRNKFANRGAIAGIEFKSKRIMHSVRYFSMPNANPFAAGIYQDLKIGLLSFTKIEFTENFQIENQYRKNQQLQRVVFYLHILFSSIFSPAKTNEKKSFLEKDIISFYYRNLSHRKGIIGVGFQSMSKRLRPILNVYSDTLGSLFSIGFGIYKKFKLAYFLGNDLAFGTPADPIFFKGMVFEGMNEDRVFTLKDNIQGIESVVNVYGFSLFALVGKYAAKEKNRFQKKYSGNKEQKWLFSFRVNYKHMF